MALSWSGRRQLMYYGVGFVIILVILYFIWASFFNTAPSCFDGKQNGDETGIDCGGSCALLCADTAHAPVVEWARAFRTTATTYTAAAEVQNNNPGAAARQVAYAFQLFDANNSLIVERDGVADIPPIATVPIIETGIDTGKWEITHALFSFSATPVFQKISQAPAPLQVSQQHLADDGSTLSANIVNNNLTAVKGVTAAAVLYDSDGVARAASKSLVGTIPARGSQEVIFTWPGGVPNIVRAEITIIPSF